MALHTTFTDLVGCDVPIQLAPMGGICTPELIAAVTEAGGMGGLAALFFPPDQLERMLGEVRAATAGPLVVNFLVPVMDEASIEVAARHATVVDFYHGDPQARLVDLVHEAGALAGWQVGSLTETHAAVAAGCDVLVVRGVEGGGRMWGAESLGPLLAAVVAAVDVPVLAAGGIGDGRGVAAALAAGAAGVRMGTRFLATHESGAHPAYKKAVIGAGGDDSVLTDEFRAGWPDAQSSARVLRASLEAARAFDGDIVAHLQLAEPIPIPRLGTVPPLQGVTGALEALPMYAGESARFVREAESAGDVVRKIAIQAEELLRRW